MSAHDQANDDEDESFPLPELPAPDVMLEPFWTLGMCAVWVAWRDRYRVVRAWGDGARELGMPAPVSFETLCDACESGWFNISQNPVPLRDTSFLVAQLVIAGRILRKNLADGRISAFERGQSGKLNGIGRIDWGADYFSKLLEREDFIAGRADFREVFIPQTELLDLWPAIDPTEIGAGAFRSRSASAEKTATEEVTRLLLAQREGLSKAAAANAVGMTSTQRAFSDRIWPSARAAAGLPLLAPPGPKKKS